MLSRNETETLLQTIRLIRKMSVLPFLLLCVILAALFRGPSHGLRYPGAVARSPSVSSVRRSSTHLRGRSFLGGKYDGLAVGLRHRRGFG